MKTKSIYILCTSILFLLISSLNAEARSIQNNSEMKDSLPYAQIPEYPETYSSANVVARMIDGLGFRYYWATEGLTEEDLEYKPSEEGRTTFATLEHLFGLSETIYNTAMNQPTVRSGENVERTYEELRAGTLNNIAMASESLKSNPDADLSTYEIGFERGDRKSSYPFWNLLNGPLADALWHCGQVVSFRRASGNPIPSGVNVFMGTKK